MWRRVVPLAVTLVVAVGTSGAGCSRGGDAALSAEEAEHLGNVALAVPEATRFEDRRAGFAVLAPGAASVTPGEIETRYRFPAAGEDAYEVAWLALALPEDGWPAFVAESRRSLLAELGGPLVEERADEGAAGREATLVIGRRDGRWTHVRLVRGDKGLYIVSAIYPSAAAEARRRALAFIASLEVLADDADEEGAEEEERTPAAKGGGAPGGPAAATRFVDAALGLSYPVEGALTLVDTAAGPSVVMRRSDGQVEVALKELKQLRKGDNGDVCAMHKASLGAAVVWGPASVAGRLGERARWTVGDGGGEVVAETCVPLGEGRAWIVRAEGAAAGERARDAWVVGLGVAEGATGMAVARATRPARWPDGEARYAWPAPGPGIGFSGPVGAKIEFDPESAFVPGGGMWTARFAGHDWEALLIAVEVPASMGDAVKERFAERFAKGFARYGLEVSRAEAAGGDVVVSGVAREGGGTGESRTVSRLGRLASGWLLVRQRTFADAEGQAVTETLVDTVTTLE